MRKHFSLEAYIGFLYKNLENEEVKILKCLRHFTRPVLN